MWELDVSARSRIANIAEAIGPENGTSMDENTVANRSAGIDRDVRMKNTVRADSDRICDEAARADVGVVANRRTFDYGMRTDCNTAAQQLRFINDSSRMNNPPDRWRRQESGSAGKGEPGIATNKNRDDRSSSLRGKSLDRRQDCTGS